MLFYIFVVICSPIPHPNGLLTKVRNADLANHANAAMGWVISASSLLVLAPLLTVGIQHLLGKDKQHKPELPNITTAQNGADRNQLPNLQIPPVSSEQSGKLQQQANSVQQQTRAAISPSNS
eukprot:NODE_372_length_8579_cov_0.477005.p2 type:complete len:122 gc:universal NODE_372_length_8579_cov_0.477005:8467-8102(-)